MKLPQRSQIKSYSLYVWCMCVWMYVWMCVCECVEHTLDIVHSFQLEYDFYLFVCPLSLISPCICPVGHFRWLSVDNQIRISGAKMWLTKQWTRCLRFAWLEKNEEKLMTTKLAFFPWDARWEGSHEWRIGNTYVYICLFEVAEEEQR